MGKDHDEAELPILGQMRRQLKRGLRRYLYTAAAILLLILMYRWLIRRPNDRSIYGYKAELVFGAICVKLVIYRMLSTLILIQLLLTRELVHAVEAESKLPHPLILLDRDLQNLNCLFFRRNCSNHLADLSSANRLFWKLMTPKATEPKVNSVKLDIYLASQCPDTTRFIRTQLMKAWSLLSHTHRIELTLVPFGKARCVSRGEDFECSCQHGANECILNQLMNCVIDRIGFPEKTVPIVNCIQGRWSFDDAMNSCIDSNPLLNSHQMRDCATGPRGRRLLALAGAQTAALRPPLDFVPWVMINDVRNVDAFYDLTENLCKSLDPAPEECSTYMQSVKKN